MLNVFIYCWFLCYATKWVPSKQLHVSAIQQLLLSADKLSHSPLYVRWQACDWEWWGEALQPGKAEWRMSCFACQIYRSCQPESRFLWTALGFGGMTKNWPIFTIQKSPGVCDIHLSWGVDPLLAKQREVICRVFLLHRKCDFFPFWLLTFAACSTRIAPLIFIFQYTAQL